MALLIKATDDKKILIKGTSIEVDSVYSRIETVSRADGSTMEVYLNYYASKEQFESNEPLAVDIEIKTIQIKDMTSEEEQGVNFGLSKAVEVFNGQGYEASEV